MFIRLDDIALHLSIWKVAFRLVSFTYNFHPVLWQRVFLIQNTCVYRYRFQVTALGLILL